MRDYLILVDPGYPGRSRELLQQIPTLSPNPVRYVFDTVASEIKAGKPAGSLPHTWQ